MNTPKLLDLLSQLIDCRTTADQPAEVDRCFSIIEKELGALPFTVENYLQNGARSMIWRSQTSKAKLLLNAHLDVVPASDQMFRLRQEDDKLLGRGVTDMKFGIACFIVGLQEIYTQTHQLPAVDIMITSDEERGGKDGAAYLAEQITEPYECVFIPDGGDDWHIIEETKGALQLQLSATGKTAHGSRPWEGSSAIDLLLQDLHTLRQNFPEDHQPNWGVTLNIGQIHGGKQVNQVSDHAVAELDFRFPATFSGSELKQQIISSCTHSRIKELAEGAPLLVKKDNPYISLWQNLIAGKTEGQIFIKETGATDGRYFAAKGMSVLLSKPIGGDLHTEEEWLSKSSFEEFTQIFMQFLQKASLL